jgi:hypothetical protein
MFGKLKTAGWGQKSITPRLSQQEIDEMDAKLCLLPGTTVLNAPVHGQKPSPNCDCDLCSPGSYRWSNCLFSLLFGDTEIRFHENLVENKLGHAVYAPPLLIEYRYESLHLARSMVLYMNRPREYLIDDQATARTNLRR